MIRTEQMTSQEVDAFHLVDDNNNNMNININNSAFNDALSSQLDASLIAYNTTTSTTTSTQQMVNNNNNNNNNSCSHQMDNQLQLFNMINGEQSIDQTAQQHDLKEEIIGESKNKLY